MSLQQKTNVSLANRENLNTRPGKQVVAAKPTAVRRAPLGEVGNKVGTKPQVNARKETTKAKPNLPSVQVAQKPTKNSTTSSAINKSTKTDNLISRRTDAVQSQFLKRQESTNLLHHVARIASDHKIDKEAAYSSKQLSGVIDVDAKDADNPCLVSEYIQDIMNYLHQLELKYPIRENYLDNHRAKPNMRTILVNWIMEVNINFQFLLETLHLSIGILDRYLQLNKNVGQETLQLVGTTAVIIAAKYEEMYMPDISDFVYICDNTYSRTQILKMEIDMLSKLRFNLGRPLSIHFLRRFNKIAGIQTEHHNLAKYLLEICLLEYELCSINPSLQAASACCLSMSILNGVDDPSKVWTNTLVHYTKYTYSAIKVTVKLLAYHLLKMEKSKYQVIRKKYSNAKVNKVSVLPELHCELVQKLSREAQVLKK